MRHTNSGSKWSSTRSEIMMDTKLSMTPITLAEPMRGLRTSSGGKWNKDFIESTSTSTFERVVWIQFLMTRYREIWAKKRVINICESIRFHHYKEQNTSGRRIKKSWTQQCSAEVGRRWWVTSRSWCVLILFINRILEIALRRWDRLLNYQLWIGWLWHIQAPSKLWLRTVGAPKTSISCPLTQLSVDSTLIAPLLSGYTTKIMVPSKTWISISKRIRFLRQSQGRTSTDPRSWR